MKEVKLSHVKVVMIKKACPNKLLCKYLYSDVDFKEDTIIKNKNRIPVSNLVHCYFEMIPLKKKKKANLQKLVERKLSPCTYKIFFENL